jgi:hypothetical protein
VRGVLRRPRDPTPDLASLPLPANVVALRGARRGASVTLLRAGNWGFGRGVYYVTVGDMGPQSGTRIAGWHVRVGFVEVYTPAARVRGPSQR